MNVAGFIAAFRRETNDRVEPYFWPDAAIVDYLNDAINEACERALLIEDSTTPDVCSIALVASQGEYALHPAVIKVKRLTFAGRALTQTSVEALDEVGTPWESQVGEPRRFILSGAGTLRLVPAPSADGAVALTAYRTQVSPLSAEAPTATPEIAERFHQRLLDWMLRCAYLQPDSETYNRGASERHEAAFAGSFGARIDANVQRKQRDRRPHAVRFIG